MSKFERRTCSELKTKLEEYIQKYGDKEVFISYFDGREQDISLFIAFDTTDKNQFYIIANEEELYEEAEEQ
jgi:hypothetical protein